MRIKLKILVILVFICSSIGFYQLGRYQTKEDIHNDPNIDQQLKNIKNIKNNNIPMIKKTNEKNIQFYNILLTLDKEIYKPGETVRVSSLLIDSYTHLPPQGDNNIYFNTKIEIIGPKGDVVYSSLNYNDELTYNIPKDISSGDYKIILYKTFQDKSFIKERSFSIQKYRSKELSFDVKLNKDSYIPGDIIETNINIKRKDNTKLSLSTKLNIKLILDDIEIIYTPNSIIYSNLKNKYSLRGKKADLECYLNNENELKLILQLKDDLIWDEGKCSLIINVNDAGTIETFSKTIPLVNNDIILNIYPEGGNLISDLEQRIYIEAKLPNELPININGQICSRNNNDNFFNTLTYSKSYKINEKNNNILNELNCFDNINTFHEGRGVSNKIKFEKKLSYYILITSSIPNQKLLYSFPTLPQDNGVVISPSFINNNNYDDDEYGANGNIIYNYNPITYSICSTLNENLKFAVYRFNNEISSRILKIKNKDENNCWNNIELSLPSKNDIDGILRITIMTEEKMIPLSERLIFHRPLGEDKINININNKQNDFIYQPGESVSFEIELKDDKNNELDNEYYMFITASDSRVKESIPIRDRSPILHSMLYLEDDILLLKDSTEYFFTTTKDHDIINDKKEIKNNVDKRLDLLLGTQGWRRFIYYQEDDKEIINNLPNGKEEYLFGINTNRNYFMRAEALGGAIKMKNQNIAFMNEMVDAEMAIPEMAGAGIAEEEEMVEDEIETDMKFDGLNIDLGEEDIKEDELLIPKDIEDHDDDVDLTKNDMKIGIIGRLPSRNYERIYAHKNQKYKDNPFAIRNDFTETLYFQSWKLMKTNKNKINFDISDLITSFDLSINIITLDGRFKSYTIPIVSTKPYTLTMKLPSELTQGDKPLIPINILKSDDNIDGKFSLSMISSVGINYFNKLSDETSHLYLDTDLKLSDTPLYIPIEIPERYHLISNINNNGNDILDKKKNDECLNCLIQSDELIQARIQGIDDNNKYILDSLQKNLIITPKGFPIKNSFSDIFDFNNNKDIIKKKIIIDNENYLDNSLSISLSLYPSPISSLNDALDSLLREPYGCFEQTSAITFPTIFALKYFRSHTNVDYSLINKAEELIKKGYKRLLSFECKNGGYEWFGNNDGHEALTSYGILEFEEINKLIPNLVDDEMLKRTKNWLKSRRDGNGKFNLNPRSIDSFGGAPNLTTNAYIIYTLIKSGYYNDLEDEINYLKKELNNPIMNDPYILSLGSLIFTELKLYDESYSFIQKLNDLQLNDGSIEILDNKYTSITSSKGSSLKIEITSLYFLSLLNLSNKSIKYKNQFINNIEKSIRYISSSCENGNFGTTQSTILALEAIIEYDKISSKVKPSKIKISLDNNILIDEIDITNDDIQSGNVIKLSLDKLEKYIMNNIKSNNEYNLIFEIMKNNNDDNDFILPFDMTLLYYNNKPNNNKDDNNKLIMNIEPNLLEMNEGDVKNININIKNLVDEIIPMFIVVIPLPSTFELNYNQLKQLKNEEKFAYYEVKNNELLLYFYKIDNLNEMNISIELNSIMPGYFYSRPSYIYIYYEPEQKYWLKGIEANIHQI